MIQDAMRKYFDRLIAAYAAAGAELRAERDPDAEPFIYQGEPDSFGMSGWRPVEKTVRHDLAALAPDLGPLHSSIDEYFNSWWFCALEGQFDSFGLTLTPVVPGIELNSFLASARAYKAAHGGELLHAPIGVEFQGLQVLVRNTDGVVVIEDWERGTFQPIADDLETMISGMLP
jgi:hypothetical protein